MTLPKVFGLSHLSEDAVAAFADGVLSPAATIRAQRHCDVCEDCADAVHGQREAAMMLRAATAPSAPSGLLDRLAGVPMSAPLPPSRGGLPTVLGDDGVPMFVAYSAPSRLTGETQPTHRRGFLPMGMLASAAAVVAAGTLGGPVQSLVASSQFSQSAPSSDSGEKEGGSAAAIHQPSTEAGTEAGAELIRPVIFAARTLPIPSDLHSARGPQPSP
jgi:hypothetical protein